MSLAAIFAAVVDFLCSVVTCCIASLCAGPVGCILIIIIIYCKNVNLSTLS